MASIYMSKFICYNVPKRPVAYFYEIVGVSEVISERFSTPAVYIFRVE